LKRNYIIIAVIAFVLSLLVPVFVQQDYTLQVLFRIYLFAALGLAWNLVGGYTGQLSLGHAAYFGAGAYGIAIFSRVGLPLWLSLILAVVVALAFALLIGGVSFRLRGPYFALATIAFAEVLRVSAKNLVRITGGDVGIQVPGMFVNQINRKFYLCAVGLTALAFVLTVWISRSKFGYYLMAIRDDEDTALAVGVNTPRSKLNVLLISAALTAIGGALYGSLFLFVVPDQVLSLDISNEIAIVAMLGGAGTILGPIVGSLVLESASELLKNIFQEAHLLIYGILLVVVVLFLPEGIVGSLRSLLRRRAMVTPPGFVKPQTPAPVVK
jgi:branched-chain amino acid transport system permease protein